MHAKRIALITLIASIALTACQAPTIGAPETAPPYYAPSATQAAAHGPAPVATPVDMFFQNYGVNPFVDAREDRLSTFALDVDTASYTVARRYLNDGLLPPADAVRVEEFVNYFQQDYAAPAGAFGLHADGAPSPFHGDDIHILRFGVQGFSVASEQRLPAALTFVIDVSGSMAMESRLELVKQSLQLLVEQLRPDDSVAIVVYGSDARVLLNPTSGEDRETILRAIAALQPEGATNAEAGLRLAYQLAAKAFRDGGINRVILCSDGVANVGMTGANGILDAVAGHASRGISLTSVGFGMGNFNDVLLEQLANKGDGHYAYVDTLAEARRLFVDNLTATLQVIGRDAKVQVDFNPDVVERYRLIGYENRAIADDDFRNDDVDAGELGAGHSATALYAVALRPDAQGRLATVQLRWQDPASGEVTEMNASFNTWELAASFEDAAPRYQLAVTVAQYAELLRGSPWADGSSLGQVWNHADRLAGLLPHDSDAAEFSHLVGQALALNGD